MSDNLGYQIGYGKPPWHTRFRKGRSGNPKGRPKAGQSFERLARQAFAEKIVIRENGERRTITKLEAALKQLANKAASGEARAVRDALKLQATLAEIERAEHAASQVDKSAPPAPVNPDPRKIALALLSVLEAAPRSEESKGSGELAPERIAAARPVVSAEPLSDEEWERKYGRNDTE